MIEREKSGIAGRLTDLAIVAALAAATSLDVSRLWRQPWLLALTALAPPLLLAWRLGLSRRALMLGLAGTVAGPLTEAACIAGGLWRYAETGGLPLIPPWLLPGWACLPLSLALVCRGLLGRLPDGPRPEMAPLLALGVSVEAAFFILLGDRPWLAAGLGLLPACGLVLGLRRHAAWIPFLAAATIGPLVEALPIAAGAWEYASRDILGQAAFMPVGYGIFGVLVTLAGLALSRPPRLAVR